MQSMVVLRWLQTQSISTSGQSKSWIKRCIEGWLCDLTGLAHRPASSDTQSPWRSIKHTCITGVFHQPGESSGDRLCQRISSKCCHCGQGHNSASAIPSWICLKTPLRRRRMFWNVQCFAKQGSNRCFGGDEKLELGPNPIMTRILDVQLHTCDCFHKNKELQQRGTHQLESSCFRIESKKYRLYVGIPGFRQVRNSKERRALSTYAECTGKRQGLVRSVPRDKGTEPTDRKTPVGELLRIQHSTRAETPWKDLYFLPLWILQEKRHRAVRTLLLSLRTEPTDIKHAKRRFLAS